MRRQHPFWCAALLLAAPAFAGVDGTVLNRTTGKPQGGATVTLYKLGQSGMESLESVKSDAQGNFNIQQTPAPGGPSLIQVAYDGVIYNHIMPPGTPLNGVSIPVYNSSRRPGDAKVSQHMVLLEPSGGQLSVNESYIFQNTGTVTYNNPDDGVLHFFLPAGANGQAQVNCTAPDGMPVRRAAEKTSQADVYKVDFPVKPGETRIDVNYALPSAPDTPFEGKNLFRGGPTRLVVPNGVTLTGDGLTAMGAEPQTQANIYEVKGESYKVTIQGSGTLRAAVSGPDSAAEQDSGPQIEQIMPRIFTRMPLILGLALGILALGFLVLYRADTQHAEPAAPAAPAKSGSAKGRRDGGRGFFAFGFLMFRGKQSSDPAAPAKGKHERGRR